MTLIDARAPVDTAERLPDPETGAGLPARMGGHFYRFVYTDWAWLAPVLALQAGLAVRVNGSVSTDEATYLVAGHQLIAHLLHGTYAQNYGTYFSGVPGLYPVLAAAIDDVLGITGVRLFSLLCMLVTNVCLFRVTRRLFGPRAAIFACFVFAVSSGATFLAWYATFDALSLMLLAVATAMAVEAAQRSPLWLAAAIGPVLVLAVAVKYVAVIYVPAVLAILAVLSLRRHPWSTAAQRVGLAAGTTVAAALLAYLVTAPSDRVGFFATSSSGRRVLDPQTKLDLLRLSWSFVGPSLLLALVGLGILIMGRRDRIVSGLLLATGLLPVVTQVIIGESTSLHKHTAFGLFFAAPLAGFAVARGLAFGRAHLGANRSATATATEHGPARPRSLRRSLVPVAIIVWVTGLLGTGMSSVENMRYGWPDSDAVVAALAPYISPSGNYLADNPSIANYAYRSRTSPTQWSAPWYFERVSSHHRLTGNPALVDAIRHDFFTVIVYRPQTFNAEQKALFLPAIAEHYRLVSQLDYGRGQAWYVWVPIT